MAVGFVIGTIPYQIPAVAEATVFEPVTVEKESSTNEDSSTVEDESTEKLMATISASPIKKGKIAKVKSNIDGCIFSS